MASKDPNTREIPFQPSTIETIDQAATSWLKELNIHVDTNKGFKQVPVQWVAPERSYSVKKNKNVRDAAGSLIMPIMTIERTSMEKDLSRKGIYWGNIDPHSDYKGGSIVVSRKINQERTSVFAAADAKYTKGHFNFPRKKC